MISERLQQFVECPFVGAHGSPADGAALAPADGGALRCPVCGRVYRGRSDGYLDLMPLEEGAHTSLYVSHEAEFEATLDYKRIAMPLLGAGVRQRAIRRMLRPRSSDRLIELGCGNGKFVFWNRRVVNWAVGIDPAPLFAREALEKVDLCRADARTLPFGAGTFSAAMSIDVLEHLPLPDIKLYLREAHRVLEPRGRIFIYSNTREPSRLDFIVRGARLLSRRLADTGVIDDSRDRLRKSDHVKAISTYPELQSVLAECGFEVEKVIFWNGLFQSVIENLVMKLAEAAVFRLQEFRNQKSEFRNQNSEIQNSKLKTQEELDTRYSAMKDRLQRRGPAFWVLRMLTELMWLDLVLFGKWRAGPYFLLARREGSG